MIRRTSTPPTLCKTVSHISHVFLRDIADADDYGLRFGETTLTDILLYEMKRNHPYTVWIRKISQQAEAVEGADWEWWFRSGNLWLGCRVQAKVLDGRTARFEHLCYRKDATTALQAEILVHRSAALNPPLPPLHVLYCGVSGPPKPCPGCANKARVREDAGILVMSSKRAVALCKSNAPIPPAHDSLEAILPGALPLSCLFCCPAHAGNLVSSVGAAMIRLDPSVPSTPGTPPGYVGYVLPASGEPDSSAAHQLEDALVERRLAGIVVIGDAE